MARGIKVVDWLIPNNEELKLVDTDYVQHTYDGEPKTQTEINDSIINGDIFKTINGNSIVGEGNIYTSTDSYVTCSTEESATEKVVVVDNYQLANGGNIRIKFTNANTATSGVTLKIKSSEDDTSAVAIPLYYSGNPVTNTNTWNARETVAVYYDGANYMANNVKGVNLKTSSIRDLSNADDTIATTEKAVATLKGDSTDSMSALTLYGLQANINDLRSSSATTGMTINGYSTSIARFITTETTEETLQVRGSCTTSTTMTLTGTGIAEPISIPTPSTTSGNYFYQIVASDSIATYQYNIAFGAGPASQRNRTLYAYYVKQIYFGALPNEDTYTFDQLLGLNGEDRKLIGFNSATRTSRQSYSMYFDNTDRRVYIAIPIDGMATVNLNLDAIYFNAVRTDTKLTQFQRITTDSDESTIRYRIYATNTNNPINPGSAGDRNIICQ